MSIPRSSSESVSMHYDYCHSRSKIEASQTPWFSQLSVIFAWHSTAFVILLFATSLFCANGNWGFVFSTNYTVFTSCWCWSYPLKFWKQSRLALKRYDILIFGLFFVAMSSRLFSGAGVIGCSIAATYEYPFSLLVPFLCRYCVALYECNHQWGGVFQWTWGSTHWCNSYSRCGFRLLLLLKEVDTFRCSHDFFEQIMSSIVPVYIVVSIFFLICNLTHWQLMLWPW